MPSSTDSATATIALLVKASEAALQLILDNWIEDHGHHQVGHAWGMLETAIEAATGKPPKAAPTDTATWALRWGNISTIRVAQSIKEYAALLDRLSEVKEYAQGITDSRLISLTKEIELLNVALAQSSFRLDASNNIFPIHS